MCPLGNWSAQHVASDTLESFLSKVAFESDFRKKTCTCVMKTFAIFLLSKETFTIRTCSILESFFRELLSKATFERQLSSVSLPYVRRSAHSVSSVKLWRTCSWKASSSSSLLLLWSPYVIGQTAIFSCCGFFLLFSSPNLITKTLNFGPFCDAR